MDFVYLCALNMRDVDPNFYPIHEASLLKDLNKKETLVTRILFLLLIGMIHLQTYFEHIGNIKCYFFFTFYLFNYYFEQKVTHIDPY